MLIISCFLVPTFATTQHSRTAFASSWLSSHNQCLWSICQCYLKICLITEGHALRSIHPILMPMMLSIKNPWRSLSSILIPLMHPTALFSLASLTFLSLQILIIVADMMRKFQLMPSWYQSILSTLATLHHQSEYVSFPLPSMSHWHATHFHTGASLHANASFLVPTPFWMTWEGLETNLQSTAKWPIHIDFSQANPHLCFGHYKHLLLLNYMLSGHYHFLWPLFIPTTTTAAFHTLSMTTCGQDGLHHPQWLTSTVGVVHAYVGQILLKLYILRVFWMTDYKLFHATFD